jgi:hypothetical protein
MADDQPHHQDDGCEPDHDIGEELAKGLQTNLQGSIFIDMLSQADGNLT